MNSVGNIKLGFTSKTRRRPVEPKQEKLDLDAPPRIHVPAQKGEAVPSASKSAPKKSDKPAKVSAAIRKGESESSKDDITKSLKEAKIPFVDKRDKGGCLWAIAPDDKKTRELMKELRKKGAHFHFSEKGGKASRGKPAWFLRGKGNH